MVRGSERVCGHWHFVSSTYIQYNPQSHQEKLILKSYTYITQAKQLLDKALKERMNMFWTTAYGLQKEKSEVGLPTLKETELTTIHEAFQAS